MGTSIYLDISENNCFEEIGSPIQLKNGHSDRLRGAQPCPN